MKNSFVLYHDYQSHFDLLSDIELAELIRAIMKYENEGVFPEFKSGAAKLAFSFIKANLDRDREKYTNKCEKNKLNVEMRWQEKNAVKNTNVYERKNLNTKYTDTDTVTDIDTDTDTGTVTENDTVTENNRPLRKLIIDQLEVM